MRMININMNSYFNKPVDRESTILDKEENTLRLSQVVWGSIHGIAKLMIDGIYTEISQIEDICECAKAIVKLVKLDMHKLK
jgi:hypothetical protein